MEQYADQNDAPARPATPAKTATPSQLDIITHPPTPNTILSVKAGPGSGKTYTLTRRISHLIQTHELQPNEILVLSMANRSVNSLKNSLALLIGEETASQVDISTFHSFCGKIVDNYGEKYLSLTKKRLLDELSWRYFSVIFTTKNVLLDGHSIGQVSPTNFTKIVHELKNKPDALHQIAHKYKVNQTYLKNLLVYLEENGIMRFDDLILNAFKIINKSLENKDYIEQLFNYKVVIIDEFQDMYEQLLEIIETVISYPSENSDFKHLTIAGDPSQSIYEFLGSSPEMMDKIEHRFPMAVHHKLIKESFRCAPEILTLSKTLLPESALKNEIYSTKTSGHDPIIRVFDNPNEEYHFIVKEIIRLCYESGGLIKLSDILILARSNKQVDEINRILTENYGIETNKLTSSISWIKTKVHVLLTLLHLIERGPGNEIAFLISLLNIDFKGRTQISKLFSMSRVWGKEEGLKNDILEDYLRLHLHDKAIKRIYHRKPEVLDKIESFLEVVTNERVKLNQVNYGNQNPQLIMESLLNIVDISGLRDYLNETHIEKSETEELEYRKMILTELENFENCLNSQYNNYIKTQMDESFVSFFVKNYNEDIPVNSINHVNSSTIHTAKGLEFPVVFMVGTSNYFNGSFDSILAGKEPISDQEKRLMYVGLTRAMNLLYVGSSIKIGEMGDILDNFTTRLPTITPEYLKSFNRALPGKDKFLEGNRLFKEFSRKIHTSTVQRKIHTNTFYRIRSCPNSTNISINRQLVSVYSLLKRFK